METNKDNERERNIYQLVAIGCFFAFILISWKYTELKKAYKTAEAHKVHYCKEYNDLKCQLKNGNIR